MRHNKIRKLQLKKKQSNSRQTDKAAYAKNRQDT